MTATTAPAGPPGVAGGGSRTPDRRSLHSRRALGFAVILGLLFVALAASLAYGSNPLTLAEVWRGLLARDDSEGSLIVWTERMPRTFVAIAVGASFGVAGALIQALTRNPLADPGILGVNAGAGFAVTVGVGVFGISSTGDYVWFAFLGAAVTTMLVYAIGSAGSGSASPITLVLAGVALAAVLGGIGTFLTLIDPDTFRYIRRWGLGSIAGTNTPDTMSVLPFLVIGILIALTLSGSLNSIALGDDLARSLGSNVLRTRTLGIVAVTLLAGGGTALTGGIGFVGLMVPHIVRWFTGPDQRWIIAYSAVAAPILVLTSDVIGRVLGRPGEIEVGIVTAVIGAPVLILLVRRGKASGL